MKDLSNTDYSYKLIMNEKKPHLRINIKPLSGIILILALFLATRLYRLSEIPRGIHVDEAGMAFDALCLARYGTDRYGLSWPVYLTNYGGGQSALYAYLAAAAIRLLHFSPTVFRLPAVMGGLLTLIFGSLILRRTLGTKAAWTGALLLTVCPCFLMTSRWGLDCNLMLGFTVMSLYALMTAVSSGRKRMYALAGLSFGVTLYSYAVAFMALPFFLAPALLWLLWCKKTTITQILFFALPLGLLAAPLMLMIAFNTGLITPFSTPGFSIPILPEYRGKELSLVHLPENLNLFSILFSHDFLAYNGFAAYGTLYYLSVPFFLLGLVQAMVDAWRQLPFYGKKDQTGRQDEQKSGAACPPASAAPCFPCSDNKGHAAADLCGRFFVLLWFLVLLFVGLSMSGPNINRMNAIYFPLLYFTIQGILLCGNAVHKRMGKRSLYIVSSGVAGLYLLLFLSFARFYYQDYPQQIYPQQYFNDSLIPMLDYIDEKFPGQNREIYVDNYDDNVVHPYIYTLLRRPNNRDLWLFEGQWDNSYGPYHFNLPDETDSGGVYIMYSNGIAMAALEQAGFTWEPYELWKIYWKPQ